MMAEINKASPGFPANSASGSFKVAIDGSEPRWVGFAVKWTPPADQRTLV